MKKRKRSNNKKIMRKFIKENPIISAILLTIICLGLGIYVILETGVNWLSLLLIAMSALSLIVGIIKFIKIYKNKEMNKVNITKIYEEQIDKLLPYEFEEQVIGFLNKNGFIAKHTKYGDNFGADIIAIKDEIKYVINCKKSNEILDIDSVQEVIEAMGHYEANVGWVVSTAHYFTNQAYELAKTRHVKLFAKNELLEKLSELKNKQSV